MSEKNFVTGDKGEQAVAEILRERGYQVDPGSPGGCDLILDDFLTVEVKTANPSRYVNRIVKRWQFSLTKTDGQHKPFNEDVLILRCLTDDPCHFVIPGIVVPRALTKIDITNPRPFHYQGKWSAFYETWEMVDLMFAYVSYFGRPV